MFKAFYFYLNMSEKTEKSLKVLEPIQLDVKTFKDKQDFELFYNSHRDEFEESTTTKLNRMYKIPGYRITRVKDQLCLKKDYTKKDILNNNHENKIIILEERIQEMEKKLESTEDHDDGIVEKVQENVSKLELRFNNLLVKIKKMENIINQQTETLNMLMGAHSS